MMKRYTATTLLLALLAAGIASAKVAPPVDVRVRPLAEAPQAGKAIAVTFEITSAIAARISDIGFITRSPNSPSFQKAGLPEPWVIVGHTAPASILLTPKQAATVELSVLCNDPAEMIRIEFKFEETWVRRDFYLQPLGAKGREEDLILRTIAGTDTQPIFRDTSLAIPGFNPNSLDAVENPVGGASAAADKSNEKVSYRLYGRIVYYRPDGVLAGADGVTVRAYDRNISPPSTYLGGQVTDAWGNFDFNVGAGVFPDLFLNVTAENNAGDVVVPAFPFPTYNFNTPTYWDWAPFEKNFGSLTPTSPSIYPAFHIMTTVTRAWRFVNEVGFGAIDDVTVWWPSGDNADYVDLLDVINISSSRQWDERTVGHEYGHHFNYEYATTPGFNYCNPGGYGDSGDDCGHVSWCPESPAVAWLEGFANWFGVANRIEIEKDFGPTISTEVVESLEGCAENGDNLGSFSETEGLLTAFCMDVSDGSNEVDPSAFVNGEDKLSFGHASVLNVVDQYSPETPEQFVNLLLTAYPAQRQKIWATAANNRYNFDTTAPPTVSALSSTSHQTSGDSPDQTVDLWWNDVTDVDSGVDHYKIWVADNAGFTGPNVDGYEAPYGGTFTPPALSPGSYWFKIYTWDRAGNSSGASGYALFGPVTIRPGTPADLEPSHGTWPYPVLAKNYTGPPFVIGTFLFGNVASTYFSLSVGNGGELDATGVQHHRLYVDGVDVKSFTTTNLAAFGQFSIVDNGPYLVRGGRHNLTFIADADEEKAELDEDNNRYRRQYVWTGMGLAETWRFRSEAPDPWGGFQIYETLFQSPNCDGFSYVTQVSEFRGVVLVPNNSAGSFGDHDLRSFLLSSSPTNGFSTSGALAFSNRPAGCLDAVFSVNDLTTGTYFNVGAYRSGESHEGFYVRRVASINISPQVDVPITIANGDYLNLYRVSIGGGLPGGDFATLRVNSDPADGLLHAAVFDMATAHAGLDDPLVTGQSDSNGEIVLDFDQITGRHLVAVWQDPKDTPVPAANIAATLWIGQTPSDLKPTTPPGWYASVSPTNGAPGLPGSVPPPTQLQGNTAATYFNYAIRNESPTTAAYFSKMTYVDGVAATGAQISQLSGYANHLTNFGAQIVQGGRHTLSGVADDMFEISESSETNNVFGRQWVWSPFPLAGPGGWIIRGGPPAADGGWDHVLASPDTSAANSPVFFNCDGLRTALPGISGDDGWWQAVAVRAQGSADYDLRLHEMATGVTDGFQDIHELSNWSGAVVDYVLVNFRQTPARQFDVGVVSSHGSKNYAVQVAESGFLGTNPSGSFGTYSLAADDLVRLHEVYLDPGFLTIRAVNETGTVDWGLSLHRADVAYQSKTSVLDDGNLSWLEGGAGGNEHIAVDITEAGYYCVAVWRSDNKSVAGLYSLEFDRVSGVTVELPPVRNALVGAYPNPFNPMTTIKFELSKASDVVLQVFDLRGARVRELVRWGLPAGRHVATWNGLDDRGQQAPSGTYFVQLRAGEVRETRGISLIK